MPGNLGARDSHGPGAPRPTSLYPKIEEGEGNWGEGEICWESLSPSPSPTFNICLSKSHFSLTHAKKEAHLLHCFHFPFSLTPSQGPAVGMLQSRSPSPSRTERRRALWDIDVFIIVQAHQYEKPCWPFFPVVLGTETFISPLQEPEGYFYP